MFLKTNRSNLNFVGIELDPEIAHFEPFFKNDFGVLGISYITFLESYAPRTDHVFYSIPWFMSLPVGLLG